MRVYLPLRTDGLAPVQESGRLPGGTVYGVTTSMQAAEQDADVEDLEFDAMCAALDAAAALPGAGRRVVAAAEVAQGAVEAHPGTDGSDLPDAAVLGTATDIPLDDVVSFHVEERPGGVGEGYDALLWYDVTELTELAAG